MRSNLLITAVGMMMAVVSFGCGPKAAEEAEVREDPMAMELPADPVDRIRELKTRADQLASLADQMPGRDEEAYRPLMSRGLADFAQALRLAHSSDANGAFRVRFDTIHAASRDLAEKPMTESLRTQTTAALRSAYDALAEVQSRRFGENAELAKQVEMQRAALMPLETSQGAIYRLASAEAFREAVKTLQQVAELYVARIPAEGSTAPKSNEAEKSVTESGATETAPVAAEKVEVQTPKTEVKETPVEVDSEKAPAAPADMNK